MPLGGFAPLPLPLGGTANDGWTAAQHARAAADLVAILKTVPFAVVTFTIGGTISAFLSQPGLGPDHAPTLANVSTGVATLEWAASYKDSYERSYPVNIRRVRVGLLGTAAGKYTYEIIDPRKIRIRTFNAAGAAADRAVTVKVF